MAEDKDLFKYGAFTKNRVEAFSDGIFAILVTLLILELRVPHIENARSSSALYVSLGALVPKLISWLISFLTICIVWMNHHRIFEMFKGINVVLFWLKEPESAENVSHGCVDVMFQFSTLYAPPTFFICSVDEVNAVLNEYVVVEIWMEGLLTEGASETTTYAVFAAPLHVRFCA